MPPVTVLIFHPQAGPGAGPLERRLADARGRLARVHELGFTRAGATSVRLISGPPDRQPFGTRLRAALRDVPDGGLVVLGSGAIPLASLADRRSLVACAAGAGPLAITNNRFSSDVMAVVDVSWLRRLPSDFAADNALPRWLSEQAGVPVADLRSRYRLGVDLDSPLDLILLGARGESIDPGPHPEDRLVTDRLDAIRRVLADPAITSSPAGAGDRRAHVGGGPGLARGVCPLPGPGTGRGARVAGIGPAGRRASAATAPIAPRLGPRPRRPSRARSPAGGAW